MITLNINEPTYGKSNDEYCYWKIVNRIAEVYIAFFRDISIDLNYDVPDNTYKDKSAKVITKKEFEIKLRIVKRRIRRLKA